MQLSARTALITGAAGGIGSACARLFAAEGAFVVLFDRDERVHDLQKEIGPNAIAICGNVSNAEHLSAAVTAALQATNRIDHLVCCAGMISVGTVEETRVDDFERVMAINVTGTFLSCQAVLPTMVAQKQGSIVTIGSVFGQVSAYRLAAYCASKGAVIQLTRSVALDYAAHGVRANCLCPGMVQTNMLEDMKNQLARHRGWGQIMAGVSILAPEQLAQAVLFLASDASHGMTGAIVPVDAGYTSQ